MKIDNIEDIERHLQDMKYFFSNIDTERARLEKELLNKELERDDWLHEIELASLNAIERLKVYAKIQKVLTERREIKDKLNLISTIRGFSSKFITKGICAELNQVIENVDRLKKNNEERVYKARVVKDMKCCNKNKEAKDDI